MTAVFNSLQVRNSSGLIIGTGSATTNLLSIATANDVLTLPDTTDTLVAVNTTNTFTNKTISGGVSGNTVIANQLATTGSAVTINQNAPTSGQVLVATSATNATWQTVNINVGETISTGTATTTDATPTTIQTIAIPTGSSAFLESTIVGYNASGSYGAQLRNTFVNVAGTVTQIAAPALLTFAQTGFTGTSTYTITGTNVLVQVTGAVATTINWRSTSTLVTSV